MDIKLKMIYYVVGQPEYSECIKAALEFYTVHPMSRTVCGRKLNTALNLQLEFFFCQYSS